MSEIVLEELADQADIEVEEAAAVIHQLIRDGWLFSSHVDTDVYRIVRDR